MGRFSSRQVAFAALVLSLAVGISAHDHHEDDIPEGEAVSQDPIDSILWIHILVQTLAWGIIFPTGMVLGIIRSRFHVPVQSTGAVLAIIGYYLGHYHKGRQFKPDNVHAKFVPTLMFILITQVIMGIYLKLHWETGFNGKVRPVVVKCHGWVGKLMPIAIWTQFLFGGITALGFCRDDHLGQCLAHFIMGSAFIAYGIVLTILLLVGQVWLKNTGRSQEFFDSMVIAAWGCVNTFTEHRWGGPWVGNDLQHTSMGIVWWCAGLVGIWLSRNRYGRPKRNLIPAVVILVTGWAMSAHPQRLMVSTMVHTIFGYTLMGAGLTRLIEIAFVLRDEATLATDGKDPNSFQYLTPFLLFASGFLFMGATEEQMEILHNNHVTHVSWILILYSVAFILFLFVNMLIHLYYVHTWNQKPKVDTEAPHINGHANGHVRPADRVAQDAEEFELQGLISDDDEADSPIEKRKHAV